MEWIANPTVGAWLNERLDDDFSTVHGVVPRGFEAYARVFHSGFVRSLPGRPVPSIDEWERMPPAEQQRLQDEFVDAATTWAEAAEAFGTTFHPLAQWSSLLGTPNNDDWLSRIAPDGREFSSPAIGDVGGPHLAALAEILTAHTTTPDAGIAALWEGRGGLLGFLGTTPSRSFFQVGSDDPNHQAMLDRSTHDPFNNVFRKPTWQEGILSREISEGPRLELTDRSYVLFSAAPRAFADTDWILDAPWRDRPAEEHGFPPSAQSPNMLWPDDHAWVMVSEIDFDSTVVGGSAALIAAICADPVLEALPLDAGSSLSCDADDVNR